MTQKQRIGWQVLRQRGDEWEPVSDLAHHDYRGAQFSASVLRSMSGRKFKIARVALPDHDAA